MFIRITQSLQKNSPKKTLFFVLCISLLSLYPIYRNYYYGRAIDQYERHVQFLEVNSRFHNPWQYRVLAPLSVEFIKIIYDHTIDKILPIENYIHIELPEGADPKSSTLEFLQLMNNPDFVKYNLIYSGYRFFLNVGIYLLSFVLLSYFIRNKWLIYFGIILISFALGNAVNESDFTLHTYIDDILYLLAALVILYKKNDWYILLLTIIGAFNRETCLLIPFLYLISNIDWQSIKLRQLNLLKIIAPTSKVFMVTAFSGVAFALIFVAIRWYYGYEAQTEWKVPAGLPMLKLNLFSAIGIKSYFEMIGLFSIIPLLCLYKFRETSRILQIWFIGIVPLWFLVHWVAVVAYQSRLFLVPMLIIFIPMILEIIEKNSKYSKVQPKPEFNSFEKAHLQS
uniref:Uncharacterized protein n=1 Tax=Roseihalotalea indica TaxID=2867963 RepID=A0AA49JGE4_9BACT|nr:hypothetical protein K4G66_28835 [Tunicatimonas sp. TK19036]